MVDLFSEISQTMRNNKLRTGLTGFAVAWGIFMLIILLGLSRGVTSGFKERAGTRDMNEIAVWNGVTSLPYEGYNTGRFIQLKASTVDALAQSGNKYIGDASADKSIDSAKVAGPVDYVASGLRGVAPRAIRNTMSKLTHGRFINQADMKEKRRVVVISEKTAQTIFGTAEPDKVIGQRVRSLGLSWLVVGMYTNEWDESSNYIPFATAVGLSGGNTEVWSIRVLAENVTDIPSAKEAEDAVRSELAKIHNFNPADRSAVGIWNRLEDHITQMDGMKILDYAVWTIGIFTLLSGIVGVSNIMFVSVRERTHEIGIRRAIGAKRRNILSQIILESVSITSVFGYIGIIIGMIVMQVVKEMFGSDSPAGGGMNPLGNPSVDLAIAFKVMVVLIVAGALAGLFPALKATKVKPVEALRDE